MHTDIIAYNRAQKPSYRALCEHLGAVIDKKLLKAESKVWHRNPVWFLDGNPVVGYSVQKAGVVLLFWSGQSFDEDGLAAEGSFKAAQKMYTSLEDVRPRELSRWLTKARTVQWDYKNIVKRKGKLVRIV